MEFKGLLSILERTCNLYEMVLETAVRKTEAVKKGDIRALDQLLAEEQKLVGSIQLVEVERQRELHRLFPGKDQLPTLSECIALASGDEKILLEKWHGRLAKVLKEMKERNDLNQQLINQSLQFIHFSLNLLQLNPEQMNYGPAPSNTGGVPSTSVFDSKV